MIYKQFYSELGKLLYAVADIDGLITPKEQKALQDIVKKELVPTEAHHDEFGTDAAYYTEMEFEILDEQIIEPEAAFNSFIDFVEEHAAAFDQKMIRMCLHVTKELARAYRGTNKKEKQLIEVLRKKLNALHTKNHPHHTHDEMSD